MVTVAILKVDCGEGRVRRAGYRNFNLFRTVIQTMTTKAEKDRQKQIQEKCQALLTQMLRDEDNKYCVDCDAKGKFKWT